MLKFERVVIRLTGKWVLRLLPRERLASNRRERLSAELEEGVCAVCEDEQPLQPFEIARAVRQVSPTSNLL
jgi:hypothetical protein